MELVERLLKGDKRALARLMTITENNEQKASEIIRLLYPHIGHAHVIGITGSPGAGKSTLVDALATRYRELGKKVGILAVDPTSPFTGGSILGDRIRMQSQSQDQHVFIRSIATRGSLGGLSRATSDFVKLMDAFGVDVILIETVGTGQSEVEIVSLAHTTAVVVSPGNGDEIQMIKSGIMEIGDFFIVNKADYPGADRTAHEIEAILYFKKQNEGDWEPPVQLSIARERQGIAEIVDKFIEHHAYLLQTEKREQKDWERVQKEIDQVLKYRMEQEIKNNIRNQERYLHLVEKVKSKQLDPYTAVEELLGFYKQG